MLRTNTHTHATTLNVTECKVLRELGLLSSGKQEVFFLFSRFLFFFIIQNALHNFIMNTNGMRCRSRSRILGAKGRKATINKIKMVFRVRNCGGDGGYCFLPIGVVSISSFYSITFAIQFKNISPKVYSSVSIIMMATNDSLNVFILQLFIQFMRVVE